MNKRYFKKIVLCCVLFLGVYASVFSTKAAERPQQNAAGWRKNSIGKWYCYSDGSWPASTWSKIGEEWYYFNAQGYLVENNSFEEGTLKGIDVAVWQETIDWNAVKKFGIDFAFVRVGHGTHTVDKAFRRNMLGAEAAGIPAGVYFYSTAKTEGEAILDAQFVLKSMEGYKVSYPVVIDLEDTSQAHLTKTQLGKIAKAFCDEVRRAGYTPMLYCCEDWYKNFIDISLVNDVEKWIARYDVKWNESIPRGIWQSSCKGRVDGIRTEVDIDFGYKDYTQIIIPRTKPIENYSFRNGKWLQNSYGWWYQYYAGGYPVDKWERIEGKWYYFGSDGYMRTGWVKTGGLWYYLSSDGAMKTGWQMIYGKQYYLNANGAMQTGWKKISGKWYYFNTSGHMKTGWIKLGENWYYLQNNGVMVENDWSNKNKIYYLKNGGAMAVGWFKIDGAYYYFSASGAKVTDGWIGQYYVDTDGKWIPDMK